MNTQQNYVGRETNATSSPQMDQKAPQSPSAPDNRQSDKSLFSVDQWQLDFLQRAIDDSHTREWMFGILDIVREHTEKPDPTEFISKLFEFWVMRAPNVEKHRSGMRDMVFHTTLLARLRSMYDCFEGASRYWEIDNIDQKGGQGNV